MSKISTQELDLQIQLSLVDRIRQAALRYRSAPAEASSDALQSYVASLECLAEHVAAKCRVSRLFQAAAIPAHRKPGTGTRVIPFPANGSSDPPFTAA